MKAFYLYEKFKNWEKDYEKIFIYSDPHGIGDGLDEDAVNTHNLFNYASDEEQIENINKLVPKNSLIVFLGDMGDYSKFKKGLKCKNWILITGNHDKGPTTYMQDFIEVYSGPLFISDKILLSHEPLHDNEFIDENGVLRPSRWLNIHGHLHNMSEIENECIHKNYICVSANLHGYKPICLTDLFKHKGEFEDLTKCSLASITNIHRSTIDRAIIRKQERMNENNF